VAVLYGPAYAEIWRRALVRPGADDLFESLAAEVADYLGLDRAEAARRLRESWERRAEDLARFPGRDAGDLSGYYSGEAGILRSMYWHSLRPDRYALHSVAGLQEVQRFAEGRRVFELGHGVGSSGILFARHGYEVVLGDISAAYREFAAWRTAARGIEAAFVDLNVEAPEPASFDAAVSFDVLEHVPDPLEAVERLRRCLKPGGLLVVNVAFGRTPDNPEHLLARRTGFADWIRGLGFERIPSSSLLVFYRRDVPRAQRAVYRAQDAAWALSEDLAGRWPRVARLLRGTRTPGL
jgi:SAM-dependent methyltransferase